MKENIREQIIPLIRQKIERLEEVLRTIEKERQKMLQLMEELQDQSVDDPHQKYDFGKSVVLSIVDKSLDIFEEGTEELKKLKKQYSSVLSPK